MYSFMPELVDALFSKGYAGSLHPFKEQQAMLCEPQVRQMPGKAIAAGKHVLFLSHPCNLSQSAVLP